MLATHLTQLEDRLAVAPAAVAREVSSTLDAARATLARAARTPLTPAEHAHVRLQQRAVDAAGAILESLARRYGTSYGASA
ncbi:EscE/YscE/SsaE family type III secretion system needle protein co-chaperone [Pandoraea pnomenusa]|nr:EscE/YscE/SsaE family type III secretion system needle protein co-chaperone [Pandoraea pnomenusa]